jgi:hypothetical protein
MRQLASLSQISTSPENSCSRGDGDAKRDAVFLEAFRSGRWDALLNEFCGKCWIARSSVSGPQNRYSRRTGCGQEATLTTATPRAFERRLKLSYQPFSDQQAETY